VSDALPATLPEFEELAAERLDAGPLGYFAGGAADELTLRDNIDAWRRLQLLPRAMVDVSRRNPSTTLLGVERPHPLVVAPMAFQRVAHPDAEPGAARGAAATGTPFTLSTFATTSPAELAEAAPDATRWFQLYVFKDRGATRAVVDAAAAGGFEALVLTVDLPLFGHRERDLRTGFTVDVSVPSVGQRPEMSPEALGAMVDPSLTWEDAERLADESSMPLVVKGVLTPADARRAADSGAAAVVASNHGGRQLDTVPSGADALPAVVDEVGDEVDVLVDGGIRRGTDVLKAMALGARAVMIGRPALWGLAVGGEAGVRRVLEIFLQELDIALALAGAPVAAELDESWVLRAG
jgi:isopentenyl diphosphate isomerase/L-lactate dehydrogenase-like FMN-dependent dehydrogenase